MALEIIRNPLATQVKHRLDVFFASIGQGFNAYMAIMSRRNEIEALYRKTDAELADMGLTREDIPRHIFRGLLCG